MARYGQAFKDQAVARLLPPESASLESVSQSLSVSVATLERWRAEANKNAWCREKGVYPQELEQWQDAATQALGEPEAASRRISREHKADRRRIKELERELCRKEKALAEAAALLVLSKKLEAIFPQDKGEDA